MNKFKIVNGILLKCEYVNMKTVEIPDGVTSIGASAFSFCKSLTSVTIPSSVTSFSSFTFHGCSALETINIKREKENETK